MRRGALVPRNENHKTMTLLGMEREGKMRYRKNRRDACMSKPNNEPVIVEKPVAEMNAAELDSALALDVERLLRFGRKHKMIKDLDMLVARNTLLDLLGLSAPCEHKPPKENFDTPTVILEHMLDLAAAKGLFDNDVPQYRINFETRLMGAMMPRESEILRKFRKLYAKKGPQAATDWFYDLCVVSNYIRTAQIAKNIQWNTKTPYGELEITINLTKPEKDPKVIAMERLQPAASYPKCMLCKENIGYAGRINFPARQTHRLVPVHLAGEDFYLQYSPYAYFHEHCIILHDEHKPMEMDRRTLAQIFDFVSQFPHYTCGSNADLPIVGGSILSHMHFQGGSYAFPMQSAETLCRYRVPEYPDISVETIRWPVSTVRACGRDAAQLIGFAGRLLETWRGYSDAEADILAETMENGSPTPHNTVTPILHYDEKKGYVLDLVPRNNRTTEQYPEGIFHPHREIHHIKKENIGLIEVMGLAILPSRLAQQSEAIAAVLCGQTDAKACRAAAPEHADWLDLLVKKYGTALSPEQAQDAVKREIGAKFETCLEHAGVFKLTPDGLAAFDRFLTALGCEKL